MTKLNPLPWLAAIALLSSCASHQGIPSPSADATALQSTPESRAKPARRPGLATGWGEEKPSSIYTRDFVRASSKPYGTDTIHYNDPEGVKAMTRHPTKVRPMRRAAGGLVEWGVKSRGRYLPAYRENHGSGRRLVAGKLGAPYEIVVKNRSKSTLEIVCSVDGLDVMDGKTASYRKRGYLVDPGKTLRISGFRTSRHSVAEFKFSSVSSSYANLKHGDTRNIGVIGLAVFTRKGVDPWTWMPGEIQTRNDARPFAEAP